MQSPDDKNTELEVLIMATCRRVKGTPGTLSDAPGVEVDLQRVLLNGNDIKGKLDEEAVNNLIEKVAAKIEL